MTPATAITSTRTSRAELAAAARRGLLVGVTLLAVLLPPSLRPHSPFVARAPTPALQRQGTRWADFGAQKPSHDARYIADWIADSGDNAGYDFVVIDKKFATVYVFDADAHLRASTPALLGAARGDDTVPGIGSRPIASDRPRERTTPAGRFVGESGHDTLGEDVVWIDYDAAVAMHRVVTANPGEHRLQRLATPSIDDNRISYGCVNLPVAFYEHYIRPVFARRHAVIYILPDVKPLQQVFPSSYDVATAHGQRSAPAY